MTSRAAPRHFDDGASPEVRFAAILHVNRSGSTLFSRLLSEASDEIFVFPELAFPLWVLIEHVAGRRIAGDALHQLIAGDPRLPALGLPDDTLRAICAVNGSDDPRKLLLDIAARRLGRPPRAIVFKLERLIGFSDPLRALFGDLLFIHLVRDPRAVASSMLRSPVPEKPGFDMARGSVVFAARHWRSYVRRVAAIARRHPLFEIRFEDLCERPDVIVRAVADRLGLPAGAALPGARRYAVSELDGALHPNVFLAPAAGRLAAWRSELDPGSARVVERICRDEMAVFDYQPEPPALAPTRAAFAFAMVRHWRSMVRHAARSLLGYARRPDGVPMLRRRLAEALATWRR